MKILAADTSTKMISVAVLEGENVKWQIFEKHSRSLGSALIPAIKKLLDKIDCDITEVGLFCIGLGPGSFTGLRVSLAAMRSLSIALEKPIIGIPSFDAIAYGLAQNSKLETQNSNICVLFDAKQGKAYGRFYRRKQDDIEPVTDFILDSVENILRLIKGPTIIAGDMLEHCSGKIADNRKKDIHFAAEGLWYPRAGILAKIALDKYKMGYSDDPFSLLPLYIYPKECQVRR